MNHTIEFLSDFIIDVDNSGTDRLEQMRVCKGTQLQAALKPYVISSGKRFLEVADLYVQNGTVIRMVPFAFFFFVE